MKKLTRLRLINWHLFANETVPIDEITFLTGANGTGKSTIIDAMQIVLLGDTTGRNFNKAANDRTGRTLKGYLRGETGEKEDGTVLYLRSQRFTSYIALEFFDDVAASPFTLGIVFDTFADGSEEHHFFCLNSGFPEHNFTNVGLLENVTRALTYEEFSLWCRQAMESGDYTFFDSNLAYQQFIKVKFGNLPDKYFSLFKKAVSFSPITNISSFITEFVCDLDYNIDIEPMQKNIEQYKILELEAKKLKVKLEALSEIREDYEKFQKVKSDLRLSEYLNDRADYETVRTQIDQYRKNVDSYKMRLAEIAATVEDGQRNIADFSRQKEQLIAQKIQSDGYQMSTTLALEKSQIMEKISALGLTYQSLVASLNQYIGTFGRASEEFYSHFKNVDLDFMSEENRGRTVDFLEQSADLARVVTGVKEAIAGESLTPDLVRDFQAEMSGYRQKALALKRDFDTEIFTLQGELDVLSRDFEEMRSGRKPFNQKYMEVRNALEASLKERHPDAAVEIYCDLVDIDDRRWTKAIEAAIYAQKFNFFVDPEYYEEANRILTEITRQHSYFGVSIVDSERLIAEDFSARPDSVAAVISTDHEGARAYTDYLLGRIKRCETFAEARASGSGLLPNCTGYRGFGSWYLNLRNAQISFIGTRVDENTMFEKREERDAVNRRFEIYSDFSNHLQDIASLDLMSVNECATYVADLTQRSAIAELERHADRLDERMKEGTLKSVSQIDEKIAAFDADIKDLEQEREQLLIERGGLSNQIEHLTTETIPVSERQLSILAQKLAGYDATFVDEICVPVFASALEKSASLARIKEEARVRFIQLQSRINTAREKLLGARSAYTATYHLSYDVTKEDDNSEFDRDYESLSQVELPGYEQKINEAHQKAIKEFKDDFIYKLRTSIETVKSQIQELNVALEDVRFGRDTYRFSVQPNKNYESYYEMITDDLLLNVGDAEDSFLLKYRDNMNNLFSLISDATSDRGADEKAQILENIARFTDYRTYLVFDLLVTRNGQESSLARTFKRQSGGETQTPFYISILASFAQLYRVGQKDNTTRLVIFDEAFSKMDGTRIKEAVALLRSFGLQAILSTPSEKLRDLANDVDLILVTVHDVKKNRSYLDRFREAEKQPLKNP